MRRQGPGRPAGEGAGTRVSDLAEPIIGFRYWNLRDGELRPYRVPVLSGGRPTDGDLVVA